MKRTSASHPLRIDVVSVPGTKGQIGMTLCPGKVQRNAITGSWDRDLEADMEVIEHWGASAVVTLMQPHELKAVKVHDFARMVPEGIRHFQLPIQDGGIPDSEWEKAWGTAGADLHAALAGGGKVLIHCLGGLGRTGTVAARLLVEFGMDPEQAILAVRQARPGAIENAVQEGYVRKQKAVGSPQANPHSQTAMKPEPKAESGFKVPSHLMASLDEDFANALEVLKTKVPQAFGLPLAKPYHRIDPGMASRFRGCMLGGAAGDALGAPVEFMDLKAIQAKFGPDGIRDYVPAYGRMGAITDDTQMSLFTAEGLMRTHVRGMLRGLSSLPCVVANAYQRWYATQGGTVRIKGFDLDGWLIGHKELFSTRAPGNTCLAALKGKQHLGDGSAAKNDSKGCGGVMRAAPVGLYTASRRLPESEAFTWGCEIAALTHGHPTGQYSAGVLAMLVHALVGGNPLRESLTCAKAELRRHQNHEETLAAMEAAETLAADSVSHQQALARLGQGWIAEEALAIAIFCALRARNLEEAVVMAVNITGDSDSTGAITGNLMGAMNGIHEIPDRWLAPLELREVILEMADDLSTIAQWPLSEFPQDTPEKAREQDYWCDRYPGY